MGCHTWMFNISSPTVKKIKNDYQYYPVTYNQIIYSWKDFISKHKSHESLKEYIIQFISLYNSILKEELLKLSEQELLKLYIKENKKYRKILKSNNGI